MTGALITRFKSTDYEPIINEGDLYTTAREYLHTHGFHRAIDDTQKCFFAWKDITSSKICMRVTGIPSSRKDKVNTPIRYTLIAAAMSAEEKRCLSTWTRFFLACFTATDKEMASSAEKTLQEIGKSFDTLVENVQNDLNFAPFAKALNNVVDDSLPALVKYVSIPTDLWEKDLQFLLYSPFVKDPKNIVEILNKGAPQGAVWLDNTLACVKASPLRQKKKEWYDARKEQIFTALPLVSSFLPAGRNVLSTFRRDICSGASEVFDFFREIKQCGDRGNSHTAHDTTPCSPTRTETHTEQASSVGISVDCGHSHSAAIATKRGEASLTSATCEPEKRALGSLDDETTTAFRDKQRRLKREAMQKQLDGDTL